MVEVKATYKKGDVDKEAVILYDFGGNIQEAIEKFGEDVVFSNYLRAGKITIQAAVRRYLAAGVEGDALQEKVNGIKLGVAAERIVDPGQVALNAFAKMTPEQQLEILQKLKAMKK
ncbi:MAG: hypothetical protein BWY21_00574 [Parcubacteria group bacterium ADurb.Bin216]|nr:MAG: hypothetical protein BWY21_00574 [Parcubacteria group bacterium ADurb.Bin216]